MRIRFGLLALALATPVLSQVVINEILFDPVAANPAPTNHQWVELHNKGSQPVELGGWRISNRDGVQRSARTIPAVTIPASGYLVIHFATGEDRLEFGPEGAHLFSPDSTRLWDPDQDAVAIYSPSGIVDFLAWRRFRAPLQAGRAHADAVAAGIWRNDAALTRDFLWYRIDELFREVRPGVSAGRDRDSTDTDVPGDFESNGGRHSYFPTPGRRNLESIDTYLGGRTATSSSRRAEPVKKWTVLWYVPGNDFYSHLIELLSLQDRAASTPDVNWVIHMNEFEPRTLRGRIGSTAGQSRVELYSPDGVTEIRGINPSSTETLRNFVEWGKSNFPAERYALIVRGFGDGWKYIGSSSWVKGRYDVDRIYPGELSAALAGADLELLCLEHNFSAVAELAWQVRGTARHLLAFPDLASLPLPRVADVLASDSTLDGEGLAKRLLSELTVSASLIELRRISEFVPLIRQWSGQMLEALPIFNRRDDPSDNVQIRIMDAARRSWRAKDNNFVDLAEFAERVQSEASVPACAKRAIPEILRWMQSNVTVQAREPFYPFPGRPGDPQTRGLSIHLPAFRSHRIVPTGVSLPLPGEIIQPHDHPDDAREVDGNSRLVNYASSHDALPLAVEDEDGISQPRLDPRTEWPRKPAPEFPFPVDSGWQFFLEELYHPKADNHIVEATLGSLRILPTSTGGGECRNPNDEITVPVGAIVKLSGAGSSDADMANGQIEPYTHMWDLNDRQPCRQQPCRGPHEVDPGADALRAATDNLDADDYFANTLIDDLDARGPTQEFRCTEPGEFITNLIVGDDDHTVRFHNTLPTAGHVHPQTRSWSSKIICTAPGGSFASTGGAYPFTETGTWVYGDHALVAPAGTFTTSPRNFVPFYPFLVTPGAGVTELQVNGNSITGGASNVVYADEEGILRTRFTAGPAGSGTIGVQPLGLPNVSLPFTVVNRLAPLPTDLQVTLPVGNVTVGADASLTLGLLRNGQPLQDGIAVVWSPTSTATWVNGTRFRNDTASYYRAGSTGRFNATFRAAANGPVTVNIVAGQIFRTVTLNAVGGPRRDPTALQILPLVAPLVAGREGTVTFRVLGVQLGLAGVTVRVEIQSGEVSIPGRTGTGPFDLTTNAQGDALLRVVPDSPQPIRLRATVPSANLGANANLVVRAR